MSPFGAATLARLAAMWEAHLDQTATRERYTRVEDSESGWTTTTATASYACRVQPATSSTATAEGERTAEPNEFDVMLPSTADVIPSDELVIGAYRYRVQSVTTGRSNNYGLQARAVRL
jgi:hypothetical protein